MASLWRFHQEVLQPRFDRDQGISAGSSLLRKMAVKAEGRWWIVKLGAHRVSDRRTAKPTQENNMASGEVLRSLDHRIWKRQDDLDDQEFEPPEGFEEEIQSLLDNLSDKVGQENLYEIRLAKHHAENLAR
jgi:hypothetical protein